MTKTMKNSRLFHFLSQLAAPFPALAITTNNDDLLFLKKQSLHDIGTMPAAAELCRQYFPLMDGDIVITNDPYSGGHLPSTIMMVMGVDLIGNGSASFYFVSKVVFKPHVPLVDSVEQEGLRIPPTPIMQNQQLNKDLIQIIGENPVWPKNFCDRIEQEVHQLKRSRLLFKKLKTLTGLSLNKAELQNYFKWSASKSRALINEFPDGEFFEETNLLDKTESQNLSTELGHFIKLRIEITDGTVIFDYSRTDSSQHLHITSHCTFGSSVGAFLSLMNPAPPINSGLLKCFEIRSSQGSMVHAKFPQPVTQGLIDGPTLLAHLVLRALSKPMSQIQMASQSPSNGPFEIEFEDHHFFDLLPPGSPGRKNKEGFDGVNFWAPSHLEPSIEEIELRYPILIKNYGFRSHSGGPGGFPGGNGTTKTLQVLSPSRLRWILTQNQKPEGVKGGKSAHGPEIQLLSKGEKTELTHLRGEHTLQAGDTISFFSAGGGGYGEEDKDSHR